MNPLDQFVHLESINTYFKIITNNNVLSLPILEILNLCLLEYEQLIDSTKLHALKLNSHVELYRIHST